MKHVLIFTIILSLCSLITDANVVIKGAVKKRNTIVKVTDNFPPSCFYNNSIFKNNNTLKRIVVSSEYIFTGKISGVQKRRRDGVRPRSVFKVFIRRVLKGDIGHFGDLLNFETRTSNSSSRAFLYAEGGSWKRGCAVSGGWAALLFSKGEYRSPLKLLIDPVPTNLDHVRRVKAVIKVEDYCEPYNHDKDTEDEPQLSPSSQHCVEHDGFRVDSDPGDQPPGDNQLRSVITFPAPVVAPGTLEELSSAGVSTSAVPPAPSVSTEILLALGEAKKSEEAMGKNIPIEISERLGKILIEGLAKDQKEALMAKMLIPENFQLAKAPKLNAEVAAILTETVKNRDKRLQKSQNQLGTGIAGLVNLITELIEGNLHKTDIIKRLSEINQIFLDMHHEETMNRRRLIIPLLDKSFWSIINGVKRDDFLFGDNLNENIKVSKTIEKAGLQIKKPNITASVPKKPFQQQGNLKQPPRPAAMRSYHPPAPLPQPPPPPPQPRYYREAPLPATTRRQAPAAIRSRGTHQSRPYDRRLRR